MKLLSPCPSMVLPFTASRSVIRCSLRTVQPSGARSPVCRAGPSGAEQQSRIEWDAKVRNGLFGAAGLLSPLLLEGQVLAQEGKLGILEGRTAALIHPAMMLFLFFSTAYTGWLGLQWRTARTIPQQVKELKAQLPKASGEGERPSSPLDQEIADLEAKRKELMKAGPKDKHFNWGSLLLGLGVLIGVVGPVNTYIRLGAGIVVLWAMAAAMVPAMQKGDDNARTVHITLNCLNLALFAWQVPTGLEIVGKVMQFAPLP